MLITSYLRPLLLGALLSSLTLAYAQDDATATSAATDAATPEATTEAQDADLESSTGQKLMASFNEDNSVPEGATVIKYCNNIREKLEQYSHSEDLFGDLLLGAKRNAVNELLKDEIAQFKSKLVSNADLVDALRHLIQYDKTVQLSDGLLTPCVGLVNPYVSDADRQRFQPVQIGSLCDFTEEKVNAPLAEMRKNFIDILKGEHKTSAEKIVPIVNMMHKHENLMPQLREQLDNMVYEESVATKENAIDGTICKALYVYPVELYAASTGRDISSLITIQPPIETYDDKKKKAEIQLIVISKNYYWDLASVERIYRINAGPVDDFTIPFYHEDFQKLAGNTLKDLICIGMASCEGKTRHENQRGQDRTEKLNAWMKSAFKNMPDLSVYGINLGKHKVSGDDCKKLSREIRDAQRRILLVGITKNSDNEVDVKQALQNAMREIARSQPERLPIDPENYNLFEVIK